MSAPTLVIIGEHDLVTVEHAEAMQRALPDGRLEVVPEATHGLPMEPPKIVSRLVLDFLGAPTGQERQDPTNGLQRSRWSSDEPAENRA